MEKKADKKVILIGILVALVVILILGKILAYFTDTATATGTITAGTLKLEVTKGLENIENWNPGDINDFSFTYQNTGTKSGISRYRILLKLDNEELINYLNEGNNLLVTVYDNNQEKIILREQGSDGTYASDWIINPSILSGTIENDGVGNSVTGAFKVEFDGTAGNIYQNVSLNISAEIQLLQARITVLTQNGEAKENLTETQIASYFDDKETANWNTTSTVVESN